MIRNEDGELQPQYRFAYSQVNVRCNGGSPVMINTCGFYRRAKSADSRREISLAKDDLHQHTALYRRLSAYER